MGKLIDNKKITKIILIGLIVAVAAFASIMLLFGTTGRSGEVSAHTEEGTVSAGTMEIDTSAARAGELYGCRVEDVNDTAAVVELLETMGLEDIAGKYTATINEKDGTEVLSIRLEEPVQQESKDILDGNMEKCSQQIMALIPSVGMVQWSYSLASADDEEETCIVSLDEAVAGEQLGTDVKDYGKSAKAFRNLLTVQAEDNR